ncbi:MAG TPA: CPBP family intramembrane glutamic endopeptidase [Gemmatimonadaceae bacterium]|nr:CPBP family intramembrane glutamic endopeptidase [Gemmatimonadaceae bacterium]
MSASTGRYLIPIVTGLGITVAGLVPMVLLGQVNARARPDLPWAAILILVYYAVLVAWLSGAGPPRRTADQRRRRLRLWPPQPEERATTEGVPAMAIVALLAILTVAWVMVGRMSPIPDLSAYPTTAYRWSMFLMGGLAAGLVEEVAFRGYMQTGIERHDPNNAVWITSLVFAGSHLVKGLGALPLLPGFFIASLLYGTLARRTGTIIPGILIHTLGDLAYMYFGVLRGDSSLLFVR